MKCPHCTEVQLTEKKTPGSIYWLCNQCGGRLLGIAVLRKTSSPKFLQDVWKKAKETKEREGTCPSCSQLMKLVPTPLGWAANVCPTCFSIWLKLGELPPENSALNQKPSPLQPAVAEAIAQAFIKSESEKQKWDHWADLLKTFVTVVNGD